MLQTYISDVGADPRESARFRRAATRVAGTITATVLTLKTGIELFVRAEDAEDSNRQTVDELKALAHRLRLVRRWRCFLKRAQEVENVLLLLYSQPTELFDDPVCLAAAALMGVDRLQ